MTHVFTVERRGVHVSDTMGVFLTEAEARDAIEAHMATMPKARMHDGDGWHDFVVLRVRVGALYDVDMVARYTSKGWRGSGVKVEYRWEAR